MCFSEQASFTTAAALSAMSIGCFRITKNHKLYALAAIPLVFAIQQIAEGVQWLHFKEIWGTSQQAWLAKNIYLFIAYCFWPSWLSFSLYLPENDTKRRQFLKALLIFGLLFSSYNLWKLYYLPTYSYPMGSSIYYDAPMALIDLCPYICLVILPWLISSLPHMVPVGIIYGSSCLIAAYISENHFTSIWCYFAALISLFIFFAIKAVFNLEKT